jgi:hypothetical protein
MRVDQRYSEPTNQSVGSSKETGEELPEGVVRAPKKKKAKPAVKVDLSSQQAKDDQGVADADLAMTYGNKRTSADAAREENQRRGASLESEG